jgi:hypothetical protein
MSVQKHLPDANSKRVRLPAVVTEEPSPVWTVSSVTRASRPAPIGRAISTGNDELRSMPFCVLAEGTEQDSLKQILIPKCGRLPQW